MNNSHVKFVIVTILTCMALLSAISIALCLVMAWGLFAIGAIKSAAVLCICAAAFILYQVYVVMKNKSEIISDLKDVWQGKTKL